MIIKKIVLVIISKIKKKIRLSPWVLLILTCLTSFIPQSKKNLIHLIVIDAGHGGKDPGCLGKISYEKDLALAIALKVGKLIENHLPNVKIVYTRDDDTFVPLKQRVQLANRLEASLFISIHCNSHPKPSTLGTETYTLGLGRNAVSIRENAVIKAEKNYKIKYKNFDPYGDVSQILVENFAAVHRTQSIALAEQIENQFKNKMNRSSKGVKQSRFLVLVRANMPSALIEVGFLTNENEELYLNSAFGQTRVAACIYRGIRNYKHQLERED